MKKKYWYFLAFAVIFIVLTNQPSVVPQEHYECAGVVFDRVITKQEIYDVDGKLIDTKLYEELEGEQVEAKRDDPVVLHSNAQLNMIYTPWGFWSGLIRGFTSGSLQVYEEKTDITKYFRVNRYSFLFFLKDKEGREWGNFDSLKNEIYIGLPKKGNKPVAFSGKCERIF